MFDGRTHLVQRHRQTRDYYLPARLDRQHEKKGNSRVQKVPELCGLLCLATLLLCISSFLSEGIKQAKRSDWNRESRGRVFAFGRRRNINATSISAAKIADSNWIHDGIRIRGKRKRHSSNNNDIAHAQQAVGDAVDSAQRVPDNLVDSAQQRKVSRTRTDPTQQHAVIATTSNKNNGLERRILALGGSTTWGAKLESRLEAYPSVLSTLLGPEWTTVNVAIRATGASLPSQCIQSMIRNAGAEDHDFDVVLLEYSLNGLQNLMYLVKRLRRRYPKATVIYVDLYALRMSIHDSVTKVKPRDILKEGIKPLEADEKISKTILETPKLNWVWSEPMIDFAKNTYLEALDIISQVDGYMYGLPMPQTPAEAMQWFGLDFHHLNPLGHRQVAMGLLQVLKSMKAGGRTRTPICRGTPKDCDSSWGRGDSCYSWFETGSVPQLSITGGKMMEFAPNKYALHIGGRFGTKAAITFPNPFKESQPIELSYMSWRDPSFYPKFKVTVTGESGQSNSVLVDPINPVKAQRIYHVTVSSPLGWVEPGQNTLTIVPTETAAVPARLIGIILCGACADMNYTSAG